MNPKSLENLKLGRGKGRGRTQTYAEPKSTHGITVTDLGWQGLDALAKQKGISVSELNERIGRGILSVIDTEALEALDEQLDLEESGV